MSVPGVPLDLLRVFDDGSAAQDRRATNPRTLDDVWEFPHYADVAAWKAEAADIREHILASTGLLPMPEKCPLEPRITGRIERDGYVVEKVLLETWPGFFLGGNLYRPDDDGAQRSAIICPHGHWQRGRVHHDPDLGSLPGRFINFARQGHVVFAYDMIGYNDTFQLSHDFGGERETLWGVSLLGLQLWNSIRAVDFVESLPEVDPKRIGCTGASGGGSQTFLVTAVEPRIAASAPAVMVSAHMQGGCLCENAPSLRLKYSNVQIAACTAPRPLLLLACTNDWTKDTAEVEFPAIQGIYELFDAKDRVDYFIQDANHNYNLASRETAYRFFGEHFLGETDPEKLREQPFEVERDEDLLSLPDKRPAKGSKSRGDVVGGLISAAQSQVTEAAPRDRKSLNSYRKTFGATLQQSLSIGVPSEADLDIEVRGTVKGAGWSAERLILSRRGAGDQVPAVLFLPATRKKKLAGTLIVHEYGKAALLSNGGREVSPLIERLVDAGRAVLAIDPFLWGEYNAQAGIGARRNRAANHFSTYNRPDVGEAAQDILTGIGALAQRTSVASWDLAGIGEAGLWCLLAAAAAPKAIRRLAVDMARFDPRCDAEYIQRLNIPHILRAGGLETALALYAPRPLMICNTGEGFDIASARAIYKAAGDAEAFEVRRSADSEVAILKWLLR